MTVKSELAIAIMLCNNLIHDLDGHHIWELAKRAKKAKAIREQLYEVMKALGIN